MARRLLFMFVAAVSHGLLDMLSNGGLGVALCPVFRYFDVFDELGDFGFFDQTPKVLAWRRQLAARPSGQQAVRADYADLLRSFMRAKNSALTRAQ